MALKRLIAFMFLASTACGATYTAKTANFSDVNGCMNDRTQCASCADDVSGEIGPTCASHTTPALLDGDTLKVPNTAGLSGGIAVWGSNTLTISRAIKVIGAGMDAADQGGDLTPDPAKSTIISVAAPPAFVTAYAQADFSARISSFVVEPLSKNNSYLFSIAGLAYRHRNAGGTVVGGFRVDHIRIINTIVGGSPIDPFLFLVGGGGGGPASGNYVSGSIDHCFEDYVSGSSGAEVNTFSDPGAPLPGGIANGDGFGAYDWCSDYTYGGGDDTELHVVYIEDNVFHRGGASMGTLGGGGRLVVRHNTFWGGIAGHGPESGANSGTASWETYNNHVIGQGLRFQFVGQSMRGGAHVSFNNRFTNFGGPNQPNDLRTQVSGPYSGGSLWKGNPSGRNFFDLNEKGTITYNGVTFNPSTLPGGRVIADGRIGDVYASGTSSVSNNPTQTTQVTLNGLDGTVGGAKPGGGAWVGFVLVNVTAGLPESAGEQGLNTNNAVNNSYCLITASDNNPTNCTVTVPRGHDTWIIIGPNDHWELHRVKQYFCNLGAGKTPVMLNGGGNKNANPAMLAYNFTQSGSGYSNASQYWPTAGQAGFGCWQKNNKSRTSSTATFNPVNGLNNSDNNADQIAGGMHDELLPTYRKNDNSGDAVIAGTSNPYPVAPSQNAAYSRIGADWEAPKPGGGFYAEAINLGDPGALDGTANNKAWGAVYPNAMVTSAPAVPSINSGSTATFVAGATVVCPPSTPVANCFQVTTSGFSGTPTFSVDPAGAGETWPISNLTLSSSGVLSGTVSGVAAGLYKFTIRATHSPDTPATQQFSLTVLSPNQPPTNVSITSPANASNAGNAPQNIIINGVATDPDGTINKFDFIERTHGGSTYTSLTGNNAGDCSTGCISVTPASTQTATFTWSNVAAGSYDLAIIAYDNSNAKTQSTVAAPAGQGGPVQVTVNPGGAGNPTPAVIKVRP
jgi:hypothetical protein